MLVSLLVYVSSVLTVTNAARCANNYTASEYTSQVRVPVNCKVEPRSCPRSWKTGIPDGKAIEQPFIYTQFLICHEGFTKCGYVPLDPKTGEVLGKSGVTFGAGVDLGSKSRNYSAFQSLEPNLIDKFAPYFGLRRDLAACAIIEKPLNLTREEAENITATVMEYIASEVALQYDNDKKLRALNFLSLPRGIRTAIVSVWFQFGKPIKYPKFWGHVAKNDWNAAVGELRNFYSRPEIQQRGDLRRRNNEADIIEATFVKCQRSLDVVVLLDDSGSVKDEDFKQSLNFVSELISAFPDEQLRGPQGTRFGLATFSDYYYDEFYLSNFTSHRQYRARVERVQRLKGQTYIGGALQYVFKKQFKTNRGLRDDSLGIPRVLIVLTDGVSFDDVAKPSQLIRDNYIVIYAIGIGGYDLSQLHEMASSPSHVYTLSNFLKLETFIATLTAATCNEAKPVALGTKVRSATTRGKFQYFLFRINNQQRNLELSVDDLTGETIVYVSLSNPHPYKHDCDVAFKKYRTDKTIIISPKQHSRQVYVSVTTYSSDATFSIQGHSCYPFSCVEGTNEPKIIALNETISTKTKQSVYQYFIFTLDVGLNLKITVHNLSGDTLAYASRSNPLPNEDDNDFTFHIAEQNIKSFVISPRHVVTKRAANSQTKKLYVSVKATTASASFTIKGVSCDPRNCTESREIFIEATTSPGKSTAINMGEFNNFITIIITYIFYIFYLVF